MFSHFIQPLTTTMDVIDLVSDDESEGGGVAAAVGNAVALVANAAREYRVTVLGPPVPMPRPRFYKTVVVNKADKRLASFRDAARIDLIAQGEDVFPVMGDNPVVMEVWFCMRLPNTAFVNGDRLRLRGDLTRGGHCHYRATKPDVDNYLKFTMDALKGVAFTDDKCVVGVTAYKCLDTTPPYEGKTMIIFKAAGEATMKPIPNWDF